MLLFLSKLSGDMEGGEEDFYVALGLVDDLSNGLISSVLSSIVAAPPKNTLGLGGVVIPLVRWL